MRRITLALLGFCAAALGAAPVRAAQPFVVHEWGVVFLSGATGTIPFQPPRSAIADLPDFVLRHDSIYNPHPYYRVHRKPVIYFYGEEGLQVNVELHTPQGKPLAYWPRPQQYVEKPINDDATQVDAAGMIWNGALHKDMPEDLQPAPDESWWNKARSIPAMYFRSQIPQWGTERFIFYEATARPEESFTEEFASDHLTLVNHDSKPSGTVLVIINDAGHWHLTTVPGVDAQGSVSLEKQTLLSAGGDDKLVLDACKKQWLDFGMTAGEADVIVEIWEKEILSMRGFLILRRIPPAAYDQIFPLAITPKPDELVRVSMVFDTLPGQGQRSEWLPELKASIDQWGRDLASDDFHVRQSAADQLAAADDLAKPVLEKLIESTDPEVRTRAQTLLARLSPKLVAPPATQEAQPKPGAEDDRVIGIGH